jgi:GT2 family glycosyltransferase
VDDVGLLDYGSERILEARHYVWGNNMAVAKAVFERLGPWDEKLGHKGAERGTFEDVEFQDRARKNGFPVWFCPGAVLQHRIRRETVTPRRVVGAAFSRGLSAYWEKSMQEWGAIERAPRQNPMRCAVALAASMIGWGCAALGFSLVPRRRIFEYARRAARACGWWFGAFGAGRGSNKNFLMAKEAFVSVQKRLLALFSASPNVTA